MSTALLLLRDGASKQYARAQDGIKDFMAKCDVELRSIRTSSLHANEMPWATHNLELQDDQPAESERFDLGRWKGTAVAMIDENARMSSGLILANQWCPSILGDVLIYVAIVCDYDGSQYKESSLPACLAGT